MTPPVLRAEEVLTWARLILEPAQVTELRALEVTESGWRAPHTVSGYFDYDHLDAMAAAAVKLSPCAKGVYLVLNPIDPALIARAANRVRGVGKNDPLTSDKDILRRNWVPIDTDAQRPAGISASDQEHEAAIDRAREIRNYLRGEGWPEPILADSGNGGHLLYRVDLRREDGGIVERSLKALADRFDDDLVKVDQTVFNPARIWKVYGTLSRKGDNLAERPHRVARILEGP
jgi:hypothetical protein